MFGGIAGDSMADYVNETTDFSIVDEDELDAAVAAVRYPLDRPAGDLNSLRERLSHVMWEDAGIIRDAAGLARAEATVASLQDELMASGVGSGQRRYDMAWQDWLNLESQMKVSQMIIAAAKAREDSAGAHFRSDFSQPGPVNEAWHTIIRETEGQLQVSRQPVSFTRIEPAAMTEDSE